MKFSDSTQLKMADLIKYLTKNEAGLKRYVKFGRSALELALVPVGVFMRHLIIVQDLDPDMDPSVKNYDSFVGSLSQLFDVFHAKAFSDNFDVGSWRNKAWKKTNDELQGTKLSSTEFIKMTDLSGVPCPPPTSSCVVINAYPSVPSETSPAEPALDKAIPEFDLQTKEGRQKKREEVIADAVKKLRSEHEDCGPISAYTPKSMPTLFESKYNDKPADAHRKATDLVALMVKAGFCSDSRQAKDLQIAEMLSWNDESFESMKKVVMKNVPAKDLPEEKRWKGVFRRSSTPTKMCKDILPKKSSLKENLEFTIKQAKVIDSLISKGDVTEDDFEGLITEGLDRNVIDCWIMNFKNKKL